MNKNTAALKVFHAVPAKEEDHHSVAVSEISIRGTGIKLTFTNGISVRSP